MAGTPGSTSTPTASWVTTTTLFVPPGNTSASDPIAPGPTSTVVAARSEIDRDADHDRRAGGPTSAATTASATASGERSSVSTTKSATDS